MIQTLITSLTAVLSTLTVQPEPNRLIDYSSAEIELVEYHTKPQSRQEVRDFLVANGEGANVDLWMCILDKESTFFTYDYGLHSTDFRGGSQIYIGTWNWMNCQGNILDYRDHLQCAFKIRDVQGFAAWETYPMCI